MSRVPPGRTPDPYDIQVGKRLRQLRKSRDLTQTSLALRTGMNKDTVWLIENGHQPLKARQIIKLAYVLEVGMFDLLPIPNADTVRALRRTLKRHHERLT